jgi:hypothetical protein
VFVAATCQLQRSTLYPGSLIVNASYVRIGLFC